MKYYLVFMFSLFFLLSCGFLIKSSESVSVNIENVYFKERLNKKSSPEDIESIVVLTKLMVKATLNKDFSILEEHISESKGIYVDLKAHKTLSEFKVDLRSENSYIKTYFWDKDKLIQKKEDDSVQTVRELIMASEGLLINLFIEDQNNCEVKIHFRKNRNLEKDMNNPYFIKENGRWYIYRLF